MPNHVVIPFTPIERTLRAFILANRPELVVGRDLPRTGSGLYVRIERIGGRSDRIQGDFVIDIEVFHSNYNTAESTALDLEALLLGYPHVVKVGDQHVVFDSVEQNQGPASIFWDDDQVHRLLATYAITVRR